ncbi:helix-turn-helix domain-containing protein [Pseudomonas matsuisoli]|uniref:HTH cro/C1-type domain-containing protein n=1 Tax=Pseudomonas matsuisoli TaxID=1515666 RepID=A0A917PXP0_9PSED|nr:XRE family transcriptional regulator [Pseudomonas matsuisoli]GGJ98015.1 hypothetical protein GCM10009304_24890 [Pseudomonas matsuisoli]
MSVLEHVAGNLRRYREAANLSQQTLAEAASVSRRMVVAIESGEANVSLNTLDRLAAALDVRFADLVRQPACPDLLRIEQLVWRGQQRGSSGTLLAHAPASNGVELWDWRLMPGESYVSEPNPGWHEMLRVIEGTLTVIRESQIDEVNEGEFVAFASDGFTLANRDKRPNRFTRVVCY